MCVYVHIYVNVHTYVKKLLKCDSKAKTKSVLFNGWGIGYSKTTSECMQSVCRPDCMYTGA